MSTSIVLLSNVDERLIGRSLGRLAYVISPPRLFLKLWPTGWGSFATVGFTIADWFRSRKRYIGEHSNRSGLDSGVG